MLAEWFSPSAPGKLVTAIERGASYLAFVPDPLPPALTLDAALEQRLSEATWSLGELAGLGRTVANTNLLLGPFIRREAVLSSRIEGTKTTMAQLYLFEARESSPAPADAREVHNYVRALEYGIGRVRKEPVGLALVGELHQLLMKGVRGEQSRPGAFRDCQNYIGTVDDIHQASYVPPPVSEMHSALRALDDYIVKGDLRAPLIRIAFIHYQFEAIHPFADGNGRIGRLLIPLLMQQWGMLPAPLLYLSAWFEMRREEYYSRLRAVSEKGAWAEWIGFFLTGVAEQSRDAIARAKRLQDLQASWRQTLLDRNATPPAMKLADALFASPVVTITRAQQLVGARQYNTARLAVEQLVKLGCITQQGSGRYDKLFVARDIMRIAGGSK